MPFRRCRPARLRDAPIAATDEVGARLLVTHMALALQASELVQHSPSAVAQRFVASRLGGQHAGVLGTLRSGPDLVGIVARATVTPR